MTELVGRSEYMQEKVSRLLENEQVKHVPKESGRFTDIYKVSGDSDTYVVTHMKAEDSFSCDCQWDSNNTSSCSHAVAAEHIAGEKHE